MFGQVDEEEKLTPFMMPQALHALKAVSLTSCMSLRAFIMAEAK